MDIIEKFNDSTVVCSVFQYINREIEHIAVYDKCGLCIHQSELEPKMMNISFSIPLRQYYNQERIYPAKLERLWNFKMLDLHLINGVKFTVFLFFRMVVKLNETI